MKWILTIAVAAVPVGLAVACASHHARSGPDDLRSAQPGAGLPDPRCAFDSPPTLVKRDGNAVLQYWTSREHNVLRAGRLPADTAFAEYRRHIERAGAALRRPIADAPQPRTDDERQLWLRENQNVELAFSGRAGRIRPAQCLDALLFAYQNARYPQMTRPTEFIASILRKRVDGERVLKIYIGSGDAMFPPKGVYGFQEVERDLALGWEFWVVLHNHTIQQRGGQPALGVPAPSTSDVDLLRSLAEELGLRSAWITNGFYTIEIPATALALYAGRP